MERLTEGARALAAFLKSNGISMAAAARDLGVADPTVLDWRRGRKRPTAHHRQAIETWTRGAVPASSWMTKGERRALNVAPFKPPKSA